MFLSPNKENACRDRCHFTGPSLEAICRLNKNLRIGLIVFIAAVVIISAFAAFTAFRFFYVAKKSEEMSQWYEDNRESILFGRYVRWNYNDLWKKLHDKWVSDPGLKDDMFDYFQIEERNVNKEKK